LTTLAGRYLESPSEPESVRGTFDHMRVIGGWKVTAGIVVAAAVVFLYVLIYTRALAATVKASWSYDYGPESACSAPESFNCVDHFEIEDVTDQNRVVLIVSVANPTPAAGKVDNISASFKYGPPFGRRTIGVVAVGRDLRGSRVASDPSTARAAVFIRPAANLSLRIVSKESFDHS
jgi:hypothetical protein